MRCCGIGLPNCWSPPLCVASCPSKRSRSRSVCWSGNGARTNRLSGWNKRGAGQGRVVSALDLLRPLECHVDAAGREARTVLHVQADLEERLSRGERYLTEAAELLDHGLLPTARDRLDRARETHANHPRLAAMEERYRRVLAEQSPLPVTVPPPAAPNRLPPLVSFVVPTVPVGRTSRPSEFLHQRTDETSILRGEAHVPSRFLINDELLVITTEEAVIGNARGRGVSVPLLANVHSRHALIVRYRRDYQLVGLPNCTTLINGERLDGTRLLAHGDLIQFGPPACVWRIPVACGQLSDGPLGTRRQFVIEHSVLFEAHRRWT